MPTVEKPSQRQDAWIFWEFACFWTDPGARGLKLGSKLQKLGGGGGGWAELVAFEAVEIFACRKQEVGFILFK